MKIDWGSLVGTAIAVLIALAIWKMIGADSFIPTIMKKQ